VGRWIVPTYVVIGNFTDQGIRGVRDTVKRVEAFKAAAQKAGVTVKNFYWTLGQYDFVLTIDAPDDQTIAAVGLSVNSLGNARTFTLRAFSTDEMSQIITKMT
jgi:uncharacterized protein with GYD domain